MKVAIYDLDKTLVQRATFTPFLIFAARKIAPWRLVFLPLWLVAMLGYRAGLYDRTGLKTFGMRLIVGRKSPATLERIGREFAAHHLARSGWMDGVVAMVEADRRAGAHIAIATAAFAFYARGFADRLGIDTVIATDWDGSRIPGGNCYGATKRDRVGAWLCDNGIAGEMRFVSDSFADAPLLDQADDAVFVTASPRTARRAQARGWRVVDGIG